MPRKLLSWLGYAGFFSFCFVLFSYWTFPYDRARSYLLNKFNQQTLPGGRVKPSDLQLNIASLGPSLLLGIEMTNVELKKQVTEPEEQPMVISISSATLRPSIISLLFGTVDTHFNFNIGPGSIKGAYKQNEIQQNIKADINAIDMSKLGLDSFIGLPVKGQANGEIDLTIGKDTANTSGTIRLNVSHLVFGDGKAKFKTAMLHDGITIDAINAGDLQFAIKIEKGVGQIEKFTASGKDLKVDGSGTVTFFNPIKLARLDLTIELAFTDAYKNKSERTRTLFSLIEVQPAILTAKTNSGGLRFQISGMIDSPRYRPAGRDTAIKEKKKSRKH
jgi:type II secretion system protein N